MPLIGLAGVTVVTMFVLMKAYGTDLGPVIGKMWAVYALYAFGVRASGVVAAVEAVLTTVGGLL